MERAFAVVLPILAAGVGDEVVGEEQDGHGFQVCWEYDAVTDACYYFTPPIPCERESAEMGHARESQCILRDGPVMSCPTVRLLLASSPTYLLYKVATYLIS